MILKKNILLLVFSFWICFMMRGQVMHSSNAMEFSIGVESFSQFIAQSADFQFIGGNFLLDEKYRWRPVVAGKYRKFLDAGNYYGFGLQVGYISWDDKLLLERNEEIKFSGSYQYSFLINKEKYSNFQFFIGGIADVYASSANKKEADFFFFSFLRRNLFGARISAMPELMFLIPNSRMTISLRGIVPLIDLQRTDEDLRPSSISSFFPIRKQSNSFQFVPIKRSRFEIGFGYFLKSK